jgi:hypothetical protein
MHDVSIAASEGIKSASEKTYSYRVDLSINAALIRYLKVEAQFAGVIKKDYGFMQGEFLPKKKINKNKLITHYKGLFGEKIVQV